jgi:Winged helix DNA-binding domain
LLAARDAVRATLMRATIHLVSARDCLLLRPLMQPVPERTFKGQFGRKVDGVDRDALLAGPRRGGARAGGHVHGAARPGDAARAVAPERAGDVDDDRGVARAPRRGAAVARRARAALPRRVRARHVRFLPEYDNLALGHADRSHVVLSAPDYAAAAGRGGRRGSLLVDGMVAALWRLTLDGGAAKLRIETYGRVSKREGGAIEAEGDRLIGFLAPDATAREIELVPR